MELVYILEALLTARFPGSPNAVVRLTADELLAITGGTVAAIKA